MRNLHCTHSAFYVLFCFRFDNVGELSTGKIDPTYHKGQTVGEIVVQVLLAASNADKLALQRYWLRDIDMNVCDYDGRTALHLSSAEGKKY